MYALTPTTIRIFFDDKQDQLRIWFFVYNERKFSIVEINCQNCERALQFACLVFDVYVLFMLFLWLRSSNVETLRWPFTLNDFYNGCFLTPACFQIEHQIDRAPENKEKEKKNT